MASFFVVFHAGLTYCTLFSVCEALDEAQLL